MINWTVESIEAESNYRREQLHRLVPQHHTVAGVRAARRHHDPISWLKHFRTQG